VKALEEGILEHKKCNPRRGGFSFYPLLNTVLSITANYKIRMVNTF